MRVLTVVLLVAIALTASACGGGESTDSDKWSREEIERYLGQKLHFPSGPPPKKLILKERKVGSGPVAERGDEVVLHYVGDIYETHAQVGRRWFGADPVAFRLGYGSYGRGLEKGVEGMRAGGRREMIIPAHLMNGANAEAAIYLVALLSVEPAGRSAATQDQ